MIGTTAALIGAGVLSAGSSIAGSAISAGAAGRAARGQTDAAKYAADLQKESADKSLDFLKDQYYDTQDRLQPYTQAGYGGLNAMLYGLGMPTQSSLGPDPYRKQRDEIQSKIDALSGMNAPTTSPEFGGNNANILQKGVWQLGDMINSLPGSRKKQLEELQAQLAAIPDAQWSQGSGSGGFTAPEGLDAGEFMKEFDAADFEKSPDYQFRLDEGKKAIEGSAAAGAGVLSGKTLKDLDTFNSGIASGEMNNAFNRFNANKTNKWNRLAAIAGFGQQANSQLTDAGNSYATGSGNILMNTASNLGNIETDAANARGSSYLAGANAWNQGITGAGNAALNAYLISKLIRR
jgi:hypothetical protein